MNWLNSHSSNKKWNHNETQTFDESKELKNSLSSLKSNEINNSFTEKQINNKKIAKSYLNQNL